MKKKFLEKEKRYLAGFTPTPNFSLQNVAKTDSLRMFNLKRKKRDSHQTSYFAKATTRKLVSGFTLIELLVVISVIALLSSIVFATLNSSRGKARDSRILQQYAQYKKAIILFSNETGHVPTSSGLKCLSDTSDNLCGYNNAWGEDPNVHSDLSKYMSSFPSTEVIQVSGGSTWEGYVYSCRVTTNGECTKARVYYVLHDTNANCAGGYTVQVNNWVGGGTTICYEDIQ